MSEYGMVVAPNTMRFERVLPAPIDRVWEYLTDSDKRAEWLARGQMEPRAGGKMTLFWKHSELTTPDDVPPEGFKSEAGFGFDGEVLAWDPPRLLKISWWNTGSEVTFELTPRGDHTLLVLTHARLPDHNALLSISGGWHAHLLLLEDRLADRPRRRFWETIAVLKQEYAARLPA